MLQVQQHKHNMCPHMLCHAGLSAYSCQVYQACCHQRASLHKDTLDLHCPCHYLRQ